MRNPLQLLRSGATFVIVAMLLAVATSSAAEKGKAKKKMEPVGDKPSITRLEPRGVEHGTEVKIRLEGVNLADLTGITFQSPRLNAVIRTDAISTRAVITVKIPIDLPRGGYDFSVKNAAGDSAKVKLYVDDLRQVNESSRTNSGRIVQMLPVSVWGTLEKPGQTDQYDFEARTGQTIVFDLGAESIGSATKEAVLTLVDARGAVLASNSGFDGGTDALLTHTFAATGRYTIRVANLTIAAAKDQYYRLSIGTFPEVVGVFPLSIPAHAESDLELVGYNLPRGARVHVKAGEPGELEVPIDPARFHTRKAFKVVVGAGRELVESEPNDTPQSAMPIPIPCVVNGRIWASRKGQAVDADLYRFDAKAGQTWVVETMAARRGSPVDTKLEILHADGTPVQRLILQAVRDSYVTFRAVDSNNPDIRLKNWEEMDLNQFVYFQGDVGRIFRMPRGPDSGCLLYTINGKRRSYFDTSPTAHANDEPCYIVEAHPPGTKLVPNGLPQFPVFFVNDDDGDRRLGTDSKLQFTAPADGSYLVRVTDSRGFGGERFAYRLIVRESKPDFTVTLQGANPVVDRGAGVDFTLAADRLDGFDGDIKIEITGLPAGLHASSPVVIQGGHQDAEGSLFAMKGLADLPMEATKKIKVTASAMVDGKQITKDVNNFGQIKLGEAPKLLIAFEPKFDPAPNQLAAIAPEKPYEIIIAPGQTVPAMLRVERNGDTNLVTLDIGNLPHGVIVDNIGLNGVQIRAGENEREIFLTAAKWVPEIDRLAHGVSNSARVGGKTGKQTSFPVLIKVRRAETSKTASAN